ncbi:MAG: hypothetical protein H7343_08370 [Undibacterium sp.]|nr:hypothetical protein [Opitutaceae bacterium]
MCSRLLRPAFLLALFAGAHAQGQTTLPKESPFMPAPGSAVAAPAANETLELGGFSGTGQKTVICITDITTKRSHWIPVGSTAEGIKVLSFDAAQDQATITVGGLQKTLRMRKSVVAAAGNAGAAAAGFAIPAAITPTQGTPQPPPAPGSVAQQETEARMLVSDLLEIGIQQRKAYEEAQKKADQEKAAKK